MEQTEPRKKRKYKQRERLKKQFTVRIDDYLAKAVIARAEGEGLNMTAAMEAGLCMWLREQGGEPPVHGRFLWTVLPMRLQRLTMSFWAFVHEEFHGSSMLEAYRKMLDDGLWGFRDDPHYAERLEKLAAGLRQTKETE